MINLAAGKCVASRAGEPTVMGSEISLLLPQIPEWQIKEVDGVKRLERIYKFKNLVQALDFTNKVAPLLRKKTTIRCSLPSRDE